MHFCIGTGNDNRISYSEKVILLLLFPSLMSPAEFLCFVLIWQFVPFAILPTEQVMAIYPFYYSEKK